MANLAFRDRTYHRRGYKYIAGIDEVGRGSLAGPVVATAVILSPNTKIRGIKDSKCLSAGKRADLFERILETCLSFGIGLIEPQTIDYINIFQATLLAARQAIQQISIKPDLIVTDNLHIEYEKVPCLAVTKGEWKFRCIAAASILAKVYRDRLMQFYHEEFPWYDFWHNKGYGTSRHIRALQEYGVSTIHRQTYKRVAELCDQNKLLKSKRFQTLEGEIKNCYQRRELEKIKAEVKAVRHFLPAPEIDQLMAALAGKKAT